MAQKTCINLVDYLEMICEDSGLGVSQSDALYCFGMSKMTVVKENANSINVNRPYGKGSMRLDLQGSFEYFHVEFCEFCEILARLACVVFEQRKESFGYIEYEREFSLAEKLSLLLELLLPRFNK